MEKIFSSPLGFSNSFNFLEQGYVIDCNPVTKTVDVRLNDSRVLTGVPILNIYGSPMGDDLTWIGNLRGARVLLVTTNGQYYVLGSMPEKVVDIEENSVSDVAVGGMAGDDPETYKKEVYQNYQANRPVDIYSGDYVLSNDNGVSLGLLKGGLLKLKASPLAQIVMGRFKDFVRIIARSFHLLTDFGEINIQQDASGKVGVEVLGGADYATETHPDKAAWTVKAYVGNNPNSPDSRLYLQVNDAAQTNYATIEFDINGNIITQASNNRTSVIGNDESIQVTSGGYNLQVDSGNATVNIAGKTVWTSSGTIDIDGGSGNLSGAVTQKCFCPFTGQTHSDWSSDVTISK